MVSLLNIHAPWEGNICLVPFMVHFFQLKGSLQLLELAESWIIFHTWTNFWAWKLYHVWISTNISMFSPSKYSHLPPQNSTLTVAEASDIICTRDFDLWCRFSFVWLCSLFSKSYIWSMPKLHLK